MGFLQMNSIAAVGIWWWVVKRVCVCLNLCVRSCMIAQDFSTQEGRKEGSKCVCDHLV